MDRETEGAVPAPRRVLLAPMEGLADWLLRDVLTAMGGYDGCVSEFVRVSGTLLPRRAFLRLAPELAQGARTPAGTPVKLQLLGADPACMADNAARGAQLSPHGIDLNFGCPAPTVNRHRGGAVLLDEPELVHAIARAVRAAVPAAVPVTAKMRLGVRDATRALECAQALADAGVAELVVHARTKLEGYRPPAHWDWIGRIRAALAVPVVANGEIWSAADWARCRAESGCEALMIGRGAVADPLLACRLRGAAGGWAQVAPGVLDYWRRVQRKVSARQAPGRLKQWLALLARAYPQAAQLAAQVRRLDDCAAIGALLAASVPRARAA